MKRTGLKLAAAWLASAALLLAGCQATPEQPVVVQKDLAQMIEKGMAQSETEEPAASGLDAAALRAHYGVPERFAAELSAQGVKVCADAAIELPQTARLPMARVEAAIFPQERVTALFEALTGGAPMYIVPETLDKARYQEEILRVQARLAAATNEDAKKMLNAMIGELTKQYDAAPDEIRLAPSDGTLMTKDVRHEKTAAASGVQTYLEATSDPGQLRVTGSVAPLSTAMRFTVYNDVDYSNTDGYSYVDESGNTQNIVPSSGSSLSFQRDESLCRYGPGGRWLADVTALSLHGGAADGCLLSTTPRQARETVERLMARLGIDDMVIDRVELYTSLEEQGSGGDGDGKIEMMTQMGLLADRPEAQGYVFRLLRQVNGVKVESDHDSSMTHIDGVSYGKEWAYETMTVAVDDAGIANVYWTGPLNVTEVLTAETAIKPWSEIAGVFETMMPVKYAPYTGVYTDFRIDVTRVCLSLQRIMERDSFTTGLLVPVWNFYGTMTFTTGDGVTMSDDGGYFPMLCVNAIDGSVIDPGKGY